MKIQCKFAEYMLAPANAIMDADTYETMDGVTCRLKYISTWNNSDGSYDEALEDVCQRKFGCSFSTIRSIWISRLGSVDVYWHLVTMIKE